MGLNQPGHLKISLQKPNLKQCWLPEPDGDHSITTVGSITHPCPGNVFSLKPICLLYIVGVKKIWIAEPQVTPLVTLAECVPCRSIPRGKMKVLDDHLEFHLLVSLLGGKDKDCSEGRGCGSVGLSWHKIEVSGFSGKSAWGAGPGIGQAVLSWQQS